jgi:hypothetical protein
LDQEVADAEIAACGEHHEAQQVANGLEIRRFGRDRAENRLRKGFTGRNGFGRYG